METLSAWLTLCEGIQRLTSNFHNKGPVSWSLDDFFAVKTKYYEFLAGLGSHFESRHRSFKSITAFESQQNSRKNVSHFSVNTVPADGLAPSANAVQT